MTDIPYSDIPYFLWAGMNGRMDIVRSMGDNPDALADTDNFGRTPLILAVQKHWHDIFEFLLPLSDPNKADNDGKTPLMYALLQHNQSAVQALMGRADVDLHRLNNEGGDAFRCARDAGQTMFFLTHLNAGHLSQTNEKGQTLLAVAQAKRRQEVVDWLTEREVALLRQSAHRAQPSMVTKRSRTRL